MKTIINKSILFVIILIIQINSIGNTSIDTEDQNITGNLIEMKTEQQCLERELIKEHPDSFKVHII